MPSFTITLTRDQADLISQALIIATYRYDDDAKADQPQRIKEQFERQADRSRALAEIFSNEAEKC
jgi:hypothetical protein